MKRALAMALGAMMVAGSAAPAAAASHIDFSGYYRAYYSMENNLGRQNGDETFTDSYFGSRLSLDVTFTPTDEIAVYWRLRGPHFQRWGSGNTANGGMALATRHIYGEIKQDWGTVLVGRLHEDLDYWGLANLGYVGGFDPIFSALSPFDDAGNIDGIRYTNRWDNGFQLIAQYSKMAALNDGDTLPDAFWDPATGWVGPANWASDRDYDRLEAEGAYFWDGGGASLGVRYDRDAFTGNGTRFAGAGDPFGPGTVNAWYLNPAVMHSWGDFSVHFEGKFGWGSAERVGLLGTNPTLEDIWDAQDNDASGYGLYLDLDYNYGPGNVTLASWWVSGTDLNDGFGLQDSESLVDMGGNFIPLVVAYNNNAYGWGRVGANAGNGNAVSLANNGFANYVNPAYTSVFNTANIDAAGFLRGSATPTNIGDAGVAGTFNRNEILNGVVGANAIVGASPFSMRRDGNQWNEDTMANNWGITLGGNHAFTDDISMHYAVGYLALNNPNYRAVNSVALAGVRADGTAMTALNPGDRVAATYGYVEQDTDLGFEVDLGFTFQLLDNLRFTTMFGYMFTGDAFKQLKGYTYTQTSAGVLDAGDGTGAMQAVWADGDDAYVWENTLQFNF